MFWHDSFYLSDWFHFNTVIFPSFDGHLYGISVKRFSKIEERITLGKQLARLLFSPDLHASFTVFLIPFLIPVRALIWRK